MRGLKNIDIRIVYRPLPASIAASMQPNAANQVLASLRCRMEEVEPDNIQMRRQPFRRIRVLYDGDPNGCRTQLIRACLDTGSSLSVIFQSKMAELGLKFSYLKKPQRIDSVTETQLLVIGKREIIFTYQRKEIEHSADVYVLKDPQTNTKPNFDILLGFDHVFTANAFRVNTDVVASTCQVSDYPPSRMPRSQR